MADKVPLKVMAETTDTDYWNDSCSVQELEYAIPNGAVGATTNPVIVTNVLKKEMHLWKDRIVEIAKQNPHFTEDEVAWKLIEEMAVKGAELLKPVFDREKGLKGRISIQTNAKFYRNARAMADQAEGFHKLAPNMQVKMPVTAAGVEAIEESTYRGVNVNATVCFTVPQAVAVAEAVEKGLKRREAEGKDTASMTPRERGYRTRLLSAAYRNWNHVAELIGGHLIHTIPYKWQLRFNGSDMPVRETALEELDPGVIETLKKNFPDFVRAYEPDGMKPEEFEFYGATRRTLRGFIAGYEDLLAIVRDLMLPNPDIE